MTAPQLPTGAAKVKAVRQMFDAIAGRYELVNGIVSLGMDRGWRNRCIEALELPVGSLVLDVACGTGDLSRELDRRLLRPVGVDLSSGMLAHARSPGPLVHADALFSPLRSAAFDGAVSGFALRNVTDLGLLFVELARVTRPGGRICLLDLAEPEAHLLRLGHRLWTNYAVPARRLCALRLGRLPLPAPQLCLPAAGLPGCRASGTSGLLRRPTRASVRWHQPALHSDPQARGRHTVTLADRDQGGGSCSAHARAPGSRAACGHDDRGRREAVAWAGPGSGPRREAPLEPSRCQPACDRRSPPPARARRLGRPGAHSRSSAMSWRPSRLTTSWAFPVAARSL